MSRRTDHVALIRQGWLLRQEHRHVVLPDISSPAEVAEAADAGASPLLSVQYPPTRGDGTANLQSSRNTLDELTRTAYRVVEDCLVAYAIDDPTADAGDPRSTVLGTRPAGRTCRGWLVLIDPDSLGDEVNPTEDVFHERVLDRAEVLGELECFTSATMVITSGLEGTLAHAAEAVTENRLEDLTVHDPDGRRHRLWIVTDEEICHRVLTTAAASDLLVVDGNHRAEAAHTAGASGMLAFLTDDPGVQMKPMHRALHTRGLTAADVVRAWHPIVGPAAPHPNGAPSRGRLVVADEAGAWEVILPTDTTDVSSRDATVQPGPEYEFVDDVLVGQALGLDPATDMTPLQDAAHAPSDADVLLLMPPISGGELHQVVGGARLPRKSVVFGPKPLTGVFLAHTPAQDVSASIPPR